ncbi:MAG TPA: serine/threonine-protein kinase, partial [Anaerolineales bacterium]|nr:serine/threonine-protein kinase [Anaerolineales bacterium]
MPEWIGKTIGKVRIEKLLARGGMAEVYLGTHLNLERPVAVKVLHSYIEEDPVPLERFHTEAKVVAGLRHPNIVQIFDFDAIDGHPYIVMEYLQGPTLAAYLRSLHLRKKRIPPDQVARLLKTLTDAIDYAHRQGIIHRDIKPSNILLHNKTDEIPLDKPLTNDVEAVVTDFGLVRVVNAASQTTSGMITGTPAYMSPEQARGDQVDHRTDIYSLGIILYEMLAGRVPFEADSTMTILHMQIHTPPPAIPGLAPAVQAVLDRALLKNPNDRYQTSQEMAIDFYLANGMTAQAEIIREPFPVITAPVKTTIETPASTEPELRAEPQPPSKSEPRIEPKPSSKPARSKAWMGVGLLALVCLSLLAVGALRFLPNFLKPAETATLSPVIPNTGISSSPTAIAALPAADGMVEIGAGTYEVGLSPADDYHVAPITLTLKDFWIDKYQ